MQVAMSAAEPIREGTVSAFIDAYAASNFPPEAFCPAYGLAEHTVGATMAGKGKLHISRKPLERLNQVHIQPSSGSDTVTLFGVGQLDDEI